MRFLARGALDNLDRTGYEHVIVRVGWVILVVVGCAGGSEPAEPPPVAEWPAAPMAPVFTPCPEGWPEVTSETGVTTCEPSSSQASCGPNEARFVGSSGCAPVGSPCPKGNFPDSVEEPAYYVLAGAASGGDGSRERPFAFVSAALARADDGATIVLGKGQYDASIELQRAITLRGACAAETRLVSTADRAPALVVLSPGARLLDLHIGPHTSNMGVIIDGGALEMRGVIIEGVDFLGVFVNGPQASLAGGDIVVRETRATPDGTSGYGMSAENGATLDVRRVVLDGNSNGGFYANGAGTTVRLSQALVAGTVSGGRSEQFAGLGVQDGATVELVQSVVEDNQGAGIIVADAQLSLDQVVIRDNLARPDGEWGVGLDVRGASEVTGGRVLLERNRRMAIRVGDTASFLLQDVVARDTLVTTSPFATGVTLVGDGIIELRRAVFERMTGTAVSLIGAERAIVEDMVVRDTALGGEGGIGFVLGGGGDVQARRILLDNNIGGSIVVDHGAFHADDVPAHVLLEDAHVVDTLPADMGLLGRALTAQRGVHVEVRRTLIEHSHEIAVMAVNEGTQVTLTEVLVMDSRARACAADACADFPAGVAIGSYHGATVQATGVTVRTAFLCGVQVATDGSLDYRDGEISGCAVGACVQNEGYDVTRITDGVLFRDNGIPLQSTDFPVPDEPIDVLSGIDEP